MKLKITKNVVLFVVVVVVVVVGRKEHFLKILQKIYVASYPGPFEKSEKRAWYPLFAHALN